MHQHSRHETLPLMHIRLVFLFLAAFVLSACDGYIEEVRIQPDGSIEFAAEARIACSDPLQVEMWGENPCDQIDTAIRTGEIGELPFNFELDPNRVSLVGDGEADRRVIDVAWSGTPEEFSSLLAGSGTVTQLNDEETEVVFTSAGTPLDQLLSSTDAGLVRELASSRWNPSEFRINVPDLVVDHNGDDIQGRIVIWNLDDELPDEFRVVFTAEDPPRQIWWYLLGSGLLLVILVMMVTLEKPPARKPKSKPKG